MCKPRIQETIGYNDNITIDAPSLFLFLPLRNSLVMWVLPYNQREPNQPTMKFGFSLSASARYSNKFKNQASVQLHYPFTWLYGVNRLVRDSQT